jgi:hypothetical protein
MFKINKPEGSRSSKKLRPGEEIVQDMSKTQADPKFSTSLGQNSFEPKRFTISNKEEI